MSAKNLLNIISNAASKEAIKRLTDDERRLMMSLAIQRDSNQLLDFFKEKGIYNGVIDDRRFYINSESEYEIYYFIKKSFNLLGCSREESIELLRGAMRSTPDEKVSVKWKSDFIYKYFNGIYEEFSDLAYDETLPALQSISIVHRVDTEAYLKSTATSITNSDYIMLSLSLLKSLSIEDGSVLETIKKIEIDYFELNYDSAVEKIIELSKSLADAHPKACEAIISRSKTITDITQETNQTRRYFETKFSQYLLGETGKPEIVASIDKISRSLINLGASDPRSAEERIAAIAESGGEDVILRHMQLKQGSEKYATKDRIMREGFLSRE